LYLTVLYLTTVFVWGLGVRRYLIRHNIPTSHMGNFPTWSWSMISDCISLVRNSSGITHLPKSFWLLIACNILTLLSILMLWNHLFEKS